MSPPSRYIVYISLNAEDIISYVLRNFSSYFIKMFPNFQYRMELIEPEWCVLEFASLCVFAH